MIDKLTIRDKVDEYEVVNMAYARGAITAKERDTLLTVIRIEMKAATGL